MEAKYSSKNDFMSLEWLTGYSRIILMPLDLSLPMNTAKAGWT